VERRLETSTRQRMHTHNLLGVDIVQIDAIIIL